MNKDTEFVNLVKKVYENIDHCIGYPVCLYPNLSGFGEWYAKTGLCDMGLNNPGNPYDEEQYILSTVVRHPRRAGMGLCHQQRHRRKYARDLLRLQAASAEDRDASHRLRFQGSTLFLLPPV